MLIKFRTSHRTLSSHLSTYNMSARPFRPLNLVYSSYKIIFPIDITSRAHYGPGVDSASNRKECYEYILGRGKCGRCVGLTTLPYPCADCLEILAASTFWNAQGLSRHCSIFHLHSNYLSHYLMCATCLAHLIALYWTTLQYFVNTLL